MWEGSREGEKVSKNMTEMDLWKFIKVSNPKFNSSTFTGIYLWESERERMIGLGGLFVLKGDGIGRWQLNLLETLSQWPTKSCWNAYDHIRRVDVCLWFQDRYILFLPTLRPYIYRTYPQKDTCQGCYNFDDVYIWDIMDYFSCWL